MESYKRTGIVSYYITSFIYVQNHSMQMYLKSNIKKICLLYDRKMCMLYFYSVYSLFMVYSILEGICSSFQRGDTYNNTLFKIVCIFHIKNFIVRN